MQATHNGFHLGVRAVMLEVDRAKELSTDGFSARPRHQSDGMRFSA